MINRAGHTVGCGKETDEPIPRRNITKREKETHTKVRNRMWLEENINSQSVVTLLLYSSLSKSSSHMQRGAKGTFVLRSLFQRGSGKRNLNKTKNRYVLRQAAWLGSPENWHWICLAMTIWPTSQVNVGNPLFSHIQTWSHSKRPTEPNTCCNTNTTNESLTQTPPQPHSPFTTSPFPSCRINVPTPVSQVPLAQLKQ